MLSSKDAETIEKAAPPHVGVTQKQLDDNAVTDANATLVEIVAAVWRDYVLNGSADTIDTIVNAAIGSRTK